MNYSTVAASHHLLSFRVIFASAPALDEISDHTKHNVASAATRSNSKVHFCHRNQNHSRSKGRNERIFPFLTSLHNAI